jgi:hypothetical protein
VREKHDTLIGTSRDLLVAIAGEAADRKKAAASAALKARR